MSASKRRLTPLAGAVPLFIAATCTNWPMPACLPGSLDRRDPRVSPLYADPTALSPILIPIGPDETLFADATHFTAAAGAVDVAVTLKVWPHMIHAWPEFNLIEHAWPKKVPLKA